MEPTIATRGRFWPSRLRREVDLRKCSLQWSVHARNRPDARLRRRCCIVSSIKVSEKHHCANDPSPSASNGVRHNSQAPHQKPALAGYAGIVAACQ